MQRNHTNQTTTRGERDYTDEALAPLNQPKVLMSLWRASMSVLDTEFSLSKKALPRVLNLNRNMPCNSSAAICLRSPSAIYSQCPTIKPTTNLKLTLSKQSSQPVLLLSTAGHRHLETKQLDLFF